jgi:formylglycine-generating enzyme required for sulfatase activity
MVGPLSSPRILLALALPLVVACNKSGEAPVETKDGGTIAITPKGKVLEAAENEAADAGAHAKKAAAFGTGERAEIPAGKLEAGSTPGDKGRDPALEPPDLEIELGAFAIDKYLYPNDPGKPPLTGVNRQKASELCQAANGRLCTELEWERACKGPDDNNYASGASWDAACAKAPTTCASGFGVLGMGASMREWTASDVQPIETVQTGKAAAVRGARGDAASVDHRCAHRVALEATQSGEDLGFRCCHGAPNAASIPSPQYKETFRKAELTAKQAAEMFASVEQLKGLSGEITYFKEPDDVKEVMNRADGGADKPANITMTTQPILWNPVPGEEVLLVAGRAQKQSFIVAFYRLPGDRYRIASSFVMKDEKGPIVLAYSGYVRKKLSWATCWDCRGESGNITYREDNRVVITQK